MKHVFTFLFSVIIIGAYAQIVTIEPTFPTISDDITIYYDATQGSAGLVGVNQIYIHTGIITESGGAGNWQNVQGNWGTDDPKVKMTNEGNDIHSISFNIIDYYELSGSEDVVELGMVFRNVDGSKEGKTESFSDIFYPIYETSAEFSGTFISPESSNFILDLNEELLIKIAFSQEAEVLVTDNGNEIINATAELIEETLVDLAEGQHIVKYTAINDGEVISDSVEFVVNPATPNIENDPDNLPYGLNRMDDTSIRLKLYAPLKNYVYIIGDFNDWKLTPAGNMNRSEDGSYYWIDIINLDATGGYSYQYLIDGEILVADPYSTLILDDFHDQFITSSTYPNLPEFPEKTSGRVSYFKMTPETFLWTDNDFVSADQTTLNIYEILLRDFLSDHSFKSLKDTLPYLKRLGINAIELMPVQEFEGNDSWGYNPSFHMALDKYYGTSTAFKELVNEAHELGIAVILDVVYNHAFSQNPYVQMYWENGKPSEESPFFNVDAKHPFNVGYDFNHESQATIDYVNKINSFWISEYHIDGFRFDLSKGFTQKFSTNDGVFASYDAGRISTLKAYADHLWNEKNSFYVILEHFATNSEEAELSNYGTMLWTNGNYAFNEATMGYNTGSKSNFNFLSYQNKGWNDPHAIGYMESHDEERLQFKNNSYGNSSSGYDIKNEEIGFDRIGMASAFFLSIPGPKMMWQFGELAYDYSINYCPDGTISENCRLSPKPVRWDYAEEQDREDLFEVFSAMMELRETEDIMHTSDFNLDVGGNLKRIWLNGEDNVFLIGNFDVSTATTIGNFQHNGIWYDYFSGDSIMVDQDNIPIDLEPGEYRMYWDKKIASPQVLDVSEIIGVKPKLVPNPVYTSIFTIETTEEVDQVIVYDVNGAIISTTYKSKKIESPLISGVYLVAIKTNNSYTIQKLVVGN